MEYLSITSKQNILSSLENTMSSFKEIYEITKNEEIMDVLQELHFEYSLIKNLDEDESFFEKRIHLMRVFNIYESGQKRIDIMQKCMTELHGAQKPM